MITHLKCVVRYDGTDFSGWQEQDGFRTVQGELHKTLERIASQPVRIQGASRTDAGVHALGQVFNCAWPGPFPERLRHSLSQILAPEIRILEVGECAPDFNARYAARGKIYAYTLDIAKEADPFSARFAWNVPYQTLDLDLVRALLPKLVGTHDFAGFQSTGHSSKTTVRTITRAELLPGGLIGLRDNPDLFRIELEGNAFLYKMVRNITGTLIEIARGRFPADFFDACLKSTGPFLGHCAPAQGLCLVKIFYEG